MEVLRIRSVTLRVGADTYGRCKGVSVQNINSDSNGEIRPIRYNVAAKKKLKKPVKLTRISELETVPPHPLKNRWTVSSRKRNVQAYFAGRTPFGGNATFHQWSLDTLERQSISDEAKFIKEFNAYIFFDFMNEHQILKYVFMPRLN